MQAGKKRGENRKANRRGLDKGNNRKNESGRMGEKNKISEKIFGYN